MTEATSITPGELTIAGSENPLTPEQQRAAVALDIASQALYPPTVFGGRGAGLTPDVNAILGAAQFVLDGDVAIDDIETHTGAPGSPLPFQIIETILQQGIDRGEFPRDINLRQSRNALWGLLNGITSLHLFTGREANKEERIRSTIQGSLNIFIKGLKTHRNGEEIISRNRNFQTI